MYGLRNTKKNKKLIRAVFRQFKIEAELRRKMLRSEAAKDGWHTRKTHELLLDYMSQHDRGETIESVPFKLLPVSGVTHFGDRIGVFTTSSYATGKK